VIAVDTNVLIYSHRADSTWHARAKALMEGLANGSTPWAIPWPCVHEFLAIATNPRVYPVPTPLEVAIGQVEAWRESPGLSLLGETSNHWQDLRALALRGRVAGGKVHDARIAALCISHGVRELWSADRDFGRFPALRVRNPLASED
jgi:toxin-antitoxin system PIN domain toxin